MSEKKTTTGIGYYFTVVAAVLAIIAMVLYRSVMYTQNIVYIFLAAVVVVEVIATVLYKVAPGNPICGFLPLINSVLCAFALVYGITLMVNQVGYVIAGLDGSDTIMSFIIYEVVIAVALLINILASFLSQTKEV